MERTSASRGDAHGAGAHSVPGSAIPRQRARAESRRFQLEEPVRGRAPARSACFSRAARCPRRSPGSRVSLACWIAGMQWSIGQMRPRSRKDDAPPQTLINPDQFSRTGDMIGHRNFRPLYRPKQDACFRLSRTPREHVEPRYPPRMRASGAEAHCNQQGRFPAARDHTRPNRWYHRNDPNRGRGEPWRTILPTWEEWSRRMLRGR
jgi:hypothetical protein